MISKAGLRKKLFEILPLDDASLDQIIDNAMALEDSEISDHFISLIGDTSLALEFIEMVKKYRRQSRKRGKATSSSTSGSSSSAGVRAASASPAAVSSINREENKKQENKKHMYKTHTTDKQQPKHEKLRPKEQKALDLKNIDELLNQVEYGTKDKGAVCTCMATRHPLNKTVPNCLNCGKIICLKESGRTNCSFCGASLISQEEKLEMIRLLQEEKGKLQESAQPKPEAKKPKPKKEKLVISMGAGQKSFFDQQRSLFDGLEKQNKMQKESEINKLENDLKKTQDNLDKLLEYQEESVARTKIIDRVSDYSLPGDSSIWTRSSFERILEMKKQQRNLRQQENKEKSRSGRGKHVVSVSIRDGKAVLAEVSESESEDEEEKEDELMEQQEKERQNKEKEKKQKKWNLDADKEKWAKRRLVYRGADAIGDIVDGDSVADDGSEKERLQMAEGSIEEMILAV